MKSRSTPCSFEARTTCRPIRPNPLMPTRIAMTVRTPVELAAVATGGRPAEGYEAHDARAAVQQRRCTLGQRGSRRHHIVDEHHVRTAKPRACGGNRTKCADNVAASRF